MTLTPNRPLTHRTRRTVATDDGALLTVTVIDTPPGSQAPTVVLAHGWGAGRPMWQDVVPHLLAAGHGVVLYDLRGHGESTLGRQGVEGITVERMAADLGTVLDAVGTRDAVLVGHSGGGFAVLSHVLAEQAATAERVRGLVLLGTAAHDQDTPASEVRLMGNPVFGWALRRKPLGRRMLRSTMGDKPSPAALETNRGMFAATAGAVRAACFASSRGMDLRAGLAGVSLPAVVLAGDKDTVVAPELGAAVAEALPRARYERLPGAGHMLPLEAPEAVARAVAEIAAQ